MSTTFADLPIKDSLLQILQERKMESPTPVQAEAIPLILQGRDAFVQSPTGTGKTYAYLLPILTRLDLQKKDVQAIVLAPTHELVMQIAREAEGLLPQAPGAVASIIGGVDVRRQVERLKKKPVLVVATPGRLLELIEQRKLKVHEVETVVVDEADRMLDPGYGKPVQEVMKRTLRDTQRLYFSATITDDLLKSAPAADSKAVIRAEAPVGAEEVLHMYLLSDPRKKVDTLRRLLRLVNARSSIVFVNQIDKVEEIVAKLTYHHLPCRLLHRDASKEERALTLQQFRDGVFPVLITTDVAARGIDIPDVACIVHFDPAPDADTYIHRSGRTGRMGRSGRVFSIVTRQELFIIRKFTRETGIEIVEKQMAYGRLEGRDNPRNSDPKRRRDKTGADASRKVEPVKKAEKRAEKRREGERGGKSAAGKREPSGQ